MSRIIPAPVLAALKATEANTATCLMIAAKDGARFGFTTAVDPVSVDLGLGAGAEIYSRGFTLSSLVLVLGLDASHSEVTGALQVDGGGDVFTRGEVHGGRFDAAKFWLFEIVQGITGLAPLLAGTVRETRVEGDAWIFELRGEADRYNQEIGDMLTPYCRADLGDARCGFALPVVAATVTAVTDSMRFAVSFAGTYASNYFNLGTVAFLTGGLAATPRMEIFNWLSGVAGAGSLVLFEPLSQAPLVGDTLNLRRGCDKTVATCVAIQGDAINFRGEPDVPSTEQALKAPVPSS